MNVLVLIPYLEDTAPSQRYRIESWARPLRSVNVNFRFVSFQSVRLNRVLYAKGHHVEKAIELARGLYRQARFLAKIERHQWDVIFLHRELAPIGPPVLERLLARKGIPIVYDFDDAIFLPNVSEANRIFAPLKWGSKTGTICRLSSHVIVGNRYLQDYALQHAEHVSIVPTTIECESYRPKESVEFRGAPTVGWSGSLHTAKHLRTAAGALRKLGKSVNFRLKVIGDRGFTLPGLEVESKDWSAETEADDLRSFDIGIMPLPNDKWSKGKCGLKALLYMAVGVPAVASPVGVNAEIIEDGRNGFLASSEEEWVQKLSLLMTDESLRWRFAREGRKTVEEWYSTKVQAPRVLDILDQARVRVSRAGCGW